MIELLAAPLSSFLRESYTAGGYVLTAVGGQ